MSSSTTINNKQSHRIHMDLKYLHDFTKSSCGYCKEGNIKKETSSKMGFTSLLSPIEYERLMFQGWRRCNDYYYYPDLIDSCCQLHSIRLNINEYKISKKQLKIMKKFKKFLMREEEDTSNHKENQVKHSEDKENNSEDISNIAKYVMNIINETSLNSILKEYSEYKTLINHIKYDKSKQTYSVNLFNHIFYHLKHKNKELFIKLNEIINTILDLNENELLMSNFEKVIKSFTSTQSTLFNSISTQSLYIHFKMNNKSYEKPSSSSNTNPNPNPNSPYTYRIELDYADEKSKCFNDKYLLYKKYQEIVHNDKKDSITKTKFKSAWANESLIKDESSVINLNDTYILSEETKEKPISTDNSNDFSLFFNKKSLKILTNYGTYTINFYINNKIIAVSVIDILPISVSSVYCFYDTDYSKYSIGVLTAIEEISFARLLSNISKSSQISQIKYYFMGFYIQTCQKMVYKGEYQPSQLLCPLSKRFFYLDSRVKEVISAYKGKELQSSEEKGLENEYFKGEYPSSKEVDVIYSLMKIEYSGKVYKIKEFITYYISNDYKEKLELTIRNLIKYVGKDLSMKIDFKL